MSREELASALTDLRVRAGLTIRQVSKAADVPVGTLSGYYSGRHIPPLSASDQLRRVLVVCGVRGEVEQQAWLAAVSRVRLSPGRRPARSVAPYLGLRSYGVSEAPWFFGREQLVEDITARITSEGSPETPLLLVGPSGSGKSSILHAGLAARLLVEETVQWRVETITPGAHPDEALNDALGRLKGAKRLLIVDQLEELFTQPEDVDERRRFSRQLAAIAERGTHVAIGLRADFYGSLLELEELARAAMENQVVVPPMSEDDLRTVLRAPARKAGVEVEEALVEVILRDTWPSRAGGNNDQVVLPLVSHVLLTTWERGHGRRLTLDAYRASGGIGGAVGATAELTYAGLSSEEQEVARRLFLRLVTVTEGVPDTRRTAAREELISSIGTDPDRVHAVLESFVATRLLTVDAARVTISHEAVLTAWPRLHRWIEEDREWLRAHHALAAAANTWNVNRRDEDLLLRGAPLELALQQADGRDTELSQLEQTFLATSQRRHDRSVRARAARARRLRLLSAGLAILALVAGGAAAVALRERSKFRLQRDLAVSRQLALTADRLRPTDETLARQIGLAAFRAARTAEASSALLNSTAVPQSSRYLGARGATQSVVHLARSKLIISAGVDGVVTLWQVGEPERELASIRVSKQSLFSLAVVREDGIIAAAGADGTLRLLDLTSPLRPSLISELQLADATLFSIVDSPNDSQLLVGSAGGEIIQVDVSAPHRPEIVDRRTRGDGAVTPVHTLAVDPVRRRVAAGFGDGIVALWSSWEMAGTERRFETGDDAPIYSVAFSPDGATLVAGGQGKVVTRWDVSTSQTELVKPVLSGPTTWINALAFSPDGGVLYAGSSDTQVWTWDLASSSPFTTLPHPGPVATLKVLGDDRVLSGGSDGVVRMWDLPTPSARGPAANVFATSFSRDGESLLTAGSDGGRLWQVGDGRLMLTPSSLRPFGGENAPSGAAALSPDGRLAALGAVDGSVHIWDVSVAGRPTNVGVLNAGTALIETVAFSPDGKRLAAGGDDATVTLWNLASGVPTSPDATLRPGDNYVMSVAFAPDGRTLAAGTLNSRVHIWDVSRPSSPEAIGEPLDEARSFVYAVSFSPDGRFLAVGGADNLVRLYRWNEGGRAPALWGAPLTGPSSLVYALAFGRSGRMLAATGGDSSVWLWRLGDGNARHSATLTGPEGTVYAVGFAGRSSTLAAAGADRVIRLWQTDPTVVARRVCQHDGASIRRSEWRRYVPGVPFEPPCQQKAT